MFLIFDTETTGLPADYRLPVTDSDNWPRLVQLSWLILNKEGEIVETNDFIIKPEGFEIPYSSEKIHGISTKLAQENGNSLISVLDEFLQALEKTEVVVGHNIEFDNKIIGAEFFRQGINYDVLFRIPSIDTKNESTEYCALPGGKGGKFKWPNLSELYRKLFDDKFSDAHNSAFDVLATARCFMELIRLGVISNENLYFKEEDSLNFQEKFTDVIPQLKGFEDSLRIQKKEKPKQSEKVSKDVEESDDDFSFTHLHVHTDYSILDGACNIKKLIEKAVNDKQKAIAITDHGNMFGVKEFHATALKNKIKPIIGCEVYVAARNDRFQRKAKLDAKNYHLILLAKNERGYKNLIKIVSLAWTEGYYYKPRVDKELLKRYSEGLIASSACLNGEVSRTLLDSGMDDAEAKAKEYKSIFGEDFYFELMRHKSGNPQIDEKVYDYQAYVNQKMLELSKKLDIKCIATNDVHFINEDDAEAHDRLICINTNTLVSAENRMRYTQQEWFKTSREMHSLFADIPEALQNTAEIADKIEVFELNSKAIMPTFPIPESFGTEEQYAEKISEAELINEFTEKKFVTLGGYEKVLRIKLEADYLQHLCLVGAKKFYGEPMVEEVKERIDFELKTIKEMGYPGYFLIVQDFISEARKMEVMVGPGRGSAAGSVVAYCLEITKLDPIKYDLLFERFLNPERVSMPDIDIDFDDDGREKVLNYVVKKYGEQKVAHIITFGKMAPKMAIRDVARVQELPLIESNRLAKLVPETPGTTFAKALKASPKLKEEYENGSAEVKSVLKMAEKLEGSVRNVGIHACGIIIGKDDLTNNIPITIAKETDLKVTQYDGNNVENVGMLKMDLLGLKTLSIIIETLKNIKLSQNIDIDIDKIPLDDKKTYALYSRGETTALFQFESDGMKKHLKNLKPTKIEDLIAMNALYRPGPMQYIPNYIARKQGKEKVIFDLPIMEEVLKDTYGITVFQEQVMILSRKMAGFTRGQSDSLRKAMGKKIKKEMDRLRPLFFEGCEKNGISKRHIEKTWKDWEEFTKYAFNKSHSACYSMISYQTGYLKAHYPAEFMSAVLTRNMGDIEKITDLIDECKKMKLPVLGPDINESFKRFAVNKKGEIRYGLAAIKGVGESAVEDIILKRQKDGEYKSVADMVKRVNLRSVNKRTLEALALAGAFDRYAKVHRAQFFATVSKNTTFIDKLIKFGGMYQESQNSAQTSLFDLSSEVHLPDPEFPETERWNELDKLKKERAVIGFYISGHPLDRYNIEMKTFCNVGIINLQDNLQKMKGRQIVFGGIVSKAAKERISKNGNPFGSFVLEDKNSSKIFTLFGGEYLQFKSFIDNDGQAILITGNVVKHWRSESEYVIRINNINLLSDVLQKRTRNIHIMIDINDFTAEIVDEIFKMTKESKGNCNLYFNLKDREDDFSCNFISTEFKVAPDEFIEKLKTIDEVKFRIEK